MIASRGASDFLRNALTSIGRCGIDMAVVRVGAPAAHLEDIARIATSFGASAALLAPDGHPVSDDYEPFGTQPFKCFAMRKFSIVRALLNEGRHVVYVDVDVAWLRNPLPYLEKVLSRYCGAAQTEAIHRFPPAFCAGFFAFAPGALSARILDRQLERIAVSESENHPVSDQELFCRTIYEEPEFLRAIFPLPEGPFPNGLLARSVAARGLDKGRAESVLKPFIFHANWTIGAANKRALLQEVGAWFVEKAGEAAASDLVLPDLSKRA